MPYRLQLPVTVSVEYYRSGLAGCARCSLSAFDICFLRVDGDKDPTVIEALFLADGTRVADGTTRVARDHARPGHEVGEHDERYLRTTVAAARSILHGSKQR